MWVETHKFWVQLSIDCWMQLKWPEYLAWLCADMSHWWLKLSCWCTWNFTVFYWAISPIYRMVISILVRLYLYCCRSARHPLLEYWRYCSLLVNHHHIHIESVPVTSRSVHAPLIRSGSHPESHHQYMEYIPSNIRADSRFASSQWETALLCNGITHWLGASLESALNMHTVLLCFVLLCLYHTFIMG